MIGNYLSSCLCGILAYFAARAIAREAIIGGVIAQVHQFPYQVSLETDEIGHLCGGGIISDRLIISAAHCFIGHKGKLRQLHIVVSAGSNDLQQHAEKRQIHKIFFPREFNPKEFDTSGDIAIVKLKHPLILSENIKELKVGNDKNETYAGKNLKIAGWGWNWAEVHSNNRVKGGFTDSLLRWADARVLSSAECQKAYPEHIIIDKKMCARVEQHDGQIRSTCKGDSGGPLVYENVVIGILSRGPIECDEKVKASIYTRVSHYQELIEHAENDRTHDDIIVYKLA